MASEDRLFDDTSIAAEPLKATYALRSVLEYAAPFIHDATSAEISSIPTQTHEDPEPPPLPV